MEGKIMRDLSILHVDDELVVAEVCKIMLERMGAQVTVVIDSLEALELFRQKPRAFDLIITDYDMPGIKGNALAARAKGIRPDIPIILMTGHVELELDHMRAWGIDGILFKPCGRVDMQRKIAGLLGAEKACAE
ncbi:MAG: response regulator [Deltaproteobacteria bacterium]|nr:response regulator [Deltaproteobacteria bacterium]